MAVLCFTFKVPLDSTSCYQESQSHSAIAVKLPTSSKIQVVAIIIVLFVKFMWMVAFGLTKMRYLNCCYQLRHILSPRITKIILLFFCFKTFIIYSLLYVLLLNLVFCVDVRIEIIMITETL